MKLVGLVAPILLLLFAAFVLRQQYFNIVDSATSESNPPAGFQIGATVTPFDSKLCGTNGSKCDFSNILGTPSPRPGLIAPGR